MKLGKTRTTKRLKTSKQLKESPATSTEVVNNFCNLGFVRYGPRFRISRTRDVPHNIQKSSSIQPGAFYSAWLDTDSTCNVHRAQENDLKGCGAAF